MAHIQKKVNSNSTQSVSPLSGDASILPNKQASSQVPQDLGKFEQFFGTVGGAA
jgi:hypothetical protein